MSAEPSIPADEVAELFRAAARGEVPVVLPSGEPSWRDAYVGDVRILIGDWQVTFFNDCMDLDYTDSAVAPDGRKCDSWCQWETNGGRGIYCPLDLLSDEERETLQQLLEAAVPVSS